jgi:hypothetical protein
MKVRSLEKPKIRPQEFVLLKSVNQVNINKTSGFNGTFKLATVKNDLTLWKQRQNCMFLRTVKQQ